MKKTLIPTLILLAGEGYLYCTPELHGYILPVLIIYMSVLVGINLP